MKKWRWRVAALALALGGWWWSRPPPPAPVVTPSMLAARPPAPVVPVRPPAPEPRPGRRPWDASVRCAFVSLLRRRGDETRYAAFLESAHRVQDAFRLERRYPHVVFHEGDIPEGHEAALRARAPWLVFRGLAGVWGTADRPPAEQWAATDRSEGYKHMCRFYGLQLWDQVADFDVVMRVDDDVFFLARAPYDPFRLLWESDADYAWGAETGESHGPTARTFGPWVRAYCEVLGGRGDCGPLARGVVDAMFFNNVFATVVDFWRGADVRRYLAAVDATGGIYVHRWGDAPIQSAAVRLFARGHVPLPGVEYAHVSTDNLIVRNQVRCLSCVGAAAYLAARAADDGAVARAVAAHAASFADDLAAAGVPRAWTDALPAVALLHLVETVGVRCDGVATVVRAPALLPTHCCCRLDTRRDSTRDRALVLETLSRQLRGWVAAGFSSSSY